MSNQKYKPSRITKIWNVIKSGGIIISILGFFFSIYSVHEQMYENNRLTWLNSIENRANEIFKLEMETPMLLCVYKNPTSNIKNYCDNIFASSENFLKGENYLRESIMVLQEISDYSKKYDKKYTDSYRWWIDALKEDSQGFFSYVVYEDFIDNVQGEDLVFSRDVLKIFELNIPDVKTKHDLFLASLPESSKNTQKPIIKSK